MVQQATLYCLLHTVYTLTEIVKSIKLSSCRMGLYLVIHMNLGICRGWVGGIWIPTLCNSCANSGMQIFSPPIRVTRSPEKISNENTH